VRRKPSGRDARRLAGLPVVAPHHPGTLHRDLAQALLRKVPAIPLQDPDPGARKGAAHGEPALLVRILGTGDGQDRGGLGQGVGHEQPRAELGLHVLRRLLEHGGPGHQSHAEGAEIPGGTALGPEFGCEHGGNP
jgi:hypothetical protein